MPENDAEVSKCILCRDHRNKLSIDATFNPVPSFEIKCKLCGHYKISKMDLFAIRQEQVEQWQLVASYVREANERGESPLNIDLELINRIDSLAPKGAIAKSRRILRAIASRSTHPGMIVYLAPQDWTLGYCQNETEFQFHLSFLHGEGTIQCEQIINGMILWDAGIVLTSHGWQILESLAATGQRSKKTFVAMAFEFELLPVYEQAIAPAVSRCGYEPIRIDKTEFLDRIDDRIIAHIRESRFVVADVTNHKNGVYFEGGFAMGIGLPVIWCCRKDHMGKVHFDTAHYNHLAWETTEQLRKDLENRIRATIGLAPGTPPPDSGN